MTNTQCMLAKMQINQAPSEYQTIIRNQEMLLKLSAALFILSAELTEEGTMYIHLGRCRSPTRSGSRIGACPAASSRTLCSTSACLVRPESWLCGAWLPRTAGGGRVGMAVGANTGCCC